jgi:hypothetical protein
VNLRRCYTALALVGACLVFAIGATSSEAGAVASGSDAPRVLAATAAITQPSVVTAPSPATPGPAFGSYAVIALETLLAAALLCYAFLQLRRAAHARHSLWIVRLRGPPLFRDCTLTAP